MGIFRDNAEGLLALGLAVLPLSGKSPLIGRYQSWRRPPKAGTVATWAQRFGDFNVGYVVAASGLVVVDADSLEAVERCRELFGDTPGRVQTRRGEHALYRAPLTEISGPVNLRAIGLEADFKFRPYDILVAPPSIHPEGGTYAWIDCAPDVLRDLPEFDLRALERALNRSAAGARHVGRAGMRDLSRGQFLNDRLVAEVSFCDEHDDLLDRARSLNDEIADRGLEPLTEAEVIKISAKVWRDNADGRIQRWGRSSGVVKLTREEIELLVQKSRYGSDATLLLCWLRFNHSARCERGETFAVSPGAMARANVIPGWSRRRYELARNILLEAGLIARVADYAITPRGRVAAQYRLAHSKGGRR